MFEEYLTQKIIQEACNIIDKAMLDKFDIKTRTLYIIEGENAGEYRTGLYDGVRGIFTKEQTDYLLAFNDGYRVGMIHLSKLASDILRR